MRHILIIICTILSCYLIDGKPIDGNAPVIVSDTVVKADNLDTGTWDDDCESLGILPLRAAGYNGVSHTVTHSVISTHPVRRIQHTDKVPFRIIKGLKVIDRHIFHSFQTDLKRFSSGIQSTDRYIHSLCQLLI